MFVQVCPVLLIKPLKSVCNNLKKINLLTFNPKWTDVSVTPPVSLKYMTDKSVLSPPGKINQIDI